MSESAERLLKQTYSEIIQGFSITRYRGNRVFVHHFGNIDDLETNVLYTDVYQNAVKKGYPTEKERLEQLEKDKLWSSGDENNIEGIKASIKSLLIAKKKAFLKRDIDSINSQIEEQEKLLNEMLYKRDSLIGATTEKFTKRAVDNFLIQQSFYKDIRLKEYLYKKEEFDELEASDLNVLFQLYNEIIDRFSEINIKKIALSNFFQNSFSLAEKVYEFYGKSISQLTDFQVQLGIYGSYYKSILNSESRPPDELLNDPDKLDDWYSSKTNAEQMLEKNVKEDGGDVSIMGATKEDLKNWGYDQLGSSLHEATKKAGGELNQEQMMRLAGIL